MRLLAVVFAAFFFSIAPASADKQPDSVWLDSLDLGYLSQGFGDSRAMKSCQGNNLSLAGDRYEHGVGTHAPGEWNIALNGACQSFNAVVGVDDEVGMHGSVEFQIYLDGKLAWRSGVMHGLGGGKRVSLPLRAAKWLSLVVTDGGDGMDSDHADWAHAYFSLRHKTTARPAAITFPAEPPAPIAHCQQSGPPRINYPKIIGCTPGKPFLFLIPATGSAPLRYDALNLPGGLSLDAQSGVISGVVPQAGRYDVIVQVRNAQGNANSTLAIVCATRKLALTPPMGWNSWNVWAATVDEGKVRAAADALILTGLAAHGYQFVNIDDGWEGSRTESGEIQPNPKFPEIKRLADDLHARGLKIGIYSSPGPQTCQHLEGSYKHEKQDADSFARWGMDYLKYDLCSYRKMIEGQWNEAHIRPVYEIMASALQSSGRDIVYSLCEYGFGDVWRWGEKAGGNLWRTTGDIGDSWGSMTRQGFGESGLEQYAGPGHWNDPDMLVVGKLGMGWGAPVHATRLTANEQITHITLWSMLSAPMLLGCDLAQLDPFTLDLLSNDEVIGVNQDPLGKQAHCVYSDCSRGGPVEVWARPLADGSFAVALFNRSVLKQEIECNLEALGLHGELDVRDLWRQQNYTAGQLKRFSALVPAHGAKLFRIKQGLHQAR